LSVRAGELAKAAEGSNAPLRRIHGIETMTAYEIVAPASSGISTGRGAYRGFGGIFGGISWEDPRWAAGAVDGIREGEGGGDDRPLGL
jgi:hypothetical protein